MRILLPALLLISSIGYSQILTVEKYNFLRDSLENEFVGHIDFGFKTKKQINTVHQGLLRANGAYVAKDWNLMLISRYNFQKAGGSEFINNGFAHLRLTLKQKKLYNPEIYVQAQYDAGLGLERRLLAGIGERFRLVQKNKTAFTFKGSFLIEDELWTETNDQITTYPQNLFLKSSLNVSLTQEIKKNLYFYFSLYHQARFTNWFKPRLFTDAQLKLAITKNLSLKNSLILAYDAAPIVEVADLYYTFQSTISYEF